MIDVFKFVRFQPEQPSKALAGLVERINGGWRPSADLMAGPRWRAAKQLGVYLWEMENVIEPLLKDRPE